MNKTLIAAAIVSTTAHASPEDIAAQLQQEAFQLQQSVQLELSAEQSPKHAAPSQLNTNHRSYFNRIASWSSESLRLRYAEIFATIYERAYARSQSLIDRINGFNQRTRDYIHKQLWYQRFLDRTAWYKAEAQKYRSLLNKVTEVSRTVDIVETTEEIKGERVLIDTKTETITETTDMIRVYEVTTETYEQEITDVTTQTTTTTIYYSNNTSKVETDELELSRVSRVETTSDTSRDLLSEEPIVDAPTEINWKSSEYMANYGLDMIGAEAAYQQGWTGDGVTVAVLDSGIDTDHADLTYSGGYSFVSDDTNVEDDHGHGTHVAGIIAATKNDFGTHGVAFDATILPVKVLNANGSGNFSDIKAGLQYAHEQGAKIANLSLGANLGYNVTKQETAAYDWWFGDTYKNVVANGTMVVMAAGNSGYDCKVKDSTYSKWIGDQQLTCSFPAALPSVAGYEELQTGGWITVGAVDSTGKMAYYSNLAGEMKNYYLVAPGSDILSTTNDGSTGTMSGTSMAAPHVSGAAALLFQKFPHLQNSDIASILFTSATDLGEEGIDEVYGHGLLNVTAAMAPIGELNIPLGNTTTGTTTSLSSSYVAAPAAFASALMESAALEEAIIIDDYERAYNVDMTEAVSMMASTYSFDNYRTANVGNLIMGFSEIEIDGQHPLVMGYQITKETSLMIGRENTIFGAVSSGALSFGEGSTWYSRLGYSNQYQDIRYSLHADYGYSAGGSVSDSYFTSRSDIHGLGFGATAHKTFGKRNQLTLSLFSPISVVSGRADLKVSNGRDMAGNVSYSESSLNLKPNAREYTMNASYLHQIDREQSLTWDLNSTVNAGNVENGWDSGIQLTYKINF